MRGHLPTLVDRTICHCVINSVTYYKYYKSQTGKDKFMSMLQQNFTDVLSLNYSSTFKANARLNHPSQQLSIKHQSHFYPHKYYIYGNVIIKIDCSTHFKLYQFVLHYSSNTSLTYSGRNMVLLIH